MTGKTHQTIGLLAGLASYLYLPAHYAPATLAAVTTVSSLGALLPDIDSPAGKIYSYMPFGTGKIGGQLVNPFLKHRNLTHSLLGYAIVILLFHHLLEHLPSYWGIDSRAVFVAGAIAYGSHLLADAVTVEGIPLFFPWHRMFGLPPYPFQGLRIETGKWFENLVIYPLVNVLLFLLLYERWSSVHQLLFK